MPASQSDLSVSGIAVSILPSSSGYGSEGLHLHGIRPEDTEPEKTSTPFSEEDGTLSLEASHTDLSRPYSEWIPLYKEISDIYISGESGDMSAKEKLLLWTQKVTAGYTGIKCTNFSSCWSDGKMFNALIHRYRPDLVDMERVQIQSNRENLEQAFEVAERLGVTRLLDAEDVDVPSPDEKSVITYVSSIYDAFPKVPEGGEGISATVWIEFGRIKLPQGYHPNHVEEEWGKLIIEMLEREKSLRPAVERLELLLQIANKIQNGALNCEEKLTLAKNTLQADAAHLESGQPVQCESDVVMYIQECEGLIRQLQVDLQILRDENYYQLEELAFRVMRLQDELVTLRLECTNLYRKGHFTSLELAPPSTLTTHLKTEPMNKTTHSSSTSWFRKPMTRTELVSISSSEDEGSLRFVYELLSWVEEMQMKLERAEWGNDLPSVELQLETQQHIHTSVEELGSSVKEARLYEGKMSQNFHTSYVETLGKLETQYCKLKETSSFRMRHLQSLHKFVSRATAELIWLNGKEEEELACDWSDSNPNISAKKTYFSFFSDARDLESFLRNLQDSIKRKYTCDHSTSLSRLEDLLQDSMGHRVGGVIGAWSHGWDEKEQLIQSKSSVASLVGRSKTIVQLKPRSPDHVLKSTISVKAICDYRQIEITICKNDECVLEDNSQRTKWKVISPTGNEAMVPSVCFLIPPPNKDAIEMASRVEQSYQKVMALWHQLHINTKSLISWNYLRKDLDLVHTWNLEKVMKNLQAHYEDFLQDSHDSALFSVADRLRLEEEVEACKSHFQHLVKSMENEDKEETVAKVYISELKNIQLRLEECEQRLLKQIQSPASSKTDRDARQDIALRIAEQEHWLNDVKDKNSVFSVLDEEITKAKEVAEQLRRPTTEQNLDLERYQEKGSQLQERWHRVIAQLETRVQGLRLKQKQDLFAEIERNQTKLDQCQKFSQQYSTIVKDYELQLMTYKAFVESQQKSPGKRRRMLSSSDAITQEFMDLRTRYTALVTLTTQHVKYISDALRRLEEEEKVVEEEKQEHVEKVKELLGWVSTLARNTKGAATSSHTSASTDIEKAILEQQVLAEELTTKKEQVSEAIKTSQIFLAKHGH
ncbi:hypothetical protein A6R68_20115, partial [Neotoma lepida]